MFLKILVINLDSNQSSPKSSSASEITLLDIYSFFLESYKTILALGLLGLAAAIAYILLTPNRYEAVAQIQMAQIMSADISASNANRLGVVIEEPALLISRLGAPTIFSQEIIYECGLGGRSNSESILASSIKATAIKNVANVIELRISGASPQVAYKCAEAVFKMIKLSQSQIAAPYIDEVITKMVDDQKRLASAQQVIENADKSGRSMSAAYFATRDEIHYLLDEITRLRNIITGSEAHPTRLVAPIYASELPVAPKKRAILLVGLFGGLIVGLLLAMSCQIVAKLKKELSETLNCHRA